MSKKQRRQITSSLTELREQLSRLVLAQPHQSGKSQLARELASQQSSYLENRTLQEAVSQMAKERPLAIRSSLFPSHQIPRSKTPLPYSELVDLLSILSQARAVRHYRLGWLSRTSEDGGRTIDLGKIAVELYAGPLSDLDPTFVQYLLNNSLGWTREVGGNVMMQFGVKRQFELGGFRPSDNDLAEAIEERSKFLARYMPSGSAPYVSPVEIEPSPDDPPGVQLGLVKRYL